MKVLLDIHTHTIVSGHAYSSLQENIAVAKSKGLAYYGVSDHAPMMPGSTHIFYFHNLKVIPKEIDGVKILKGVEANIMDFEGNIDMQAEDMANLDYAIASLHPPCIKWGTKEQNTSAVIKAMKHPMVKVIGHPDDQRYPLDYEVVVKSAKEEKVFLEVNNSSLKPNSFRANARENMTTLLTLAKEMEVPVIMGSDAHFSMDVGGLDSSYSLLEELKFPKNLIANFNLELFETYLNL